MLMMDSPLHNALHDGMAVENKRHLSLRGNAFVRLASRDKLATPPQTFRHVVEISLRPRTNTGDRKAPQWK